MYHDRWSIEEYFKYIKSSTNLKKMNEKREISIKKSMYAQLIVSQIASIFNNLNKLLENNTKIKKVNNTHLTKGIYEEFLFHFISNHKFTKYKLLRFFKEYVKYITYKLNRTAERICKRPNHLSYFKNMLKNPKSDNL